MTSGSFINTMMDGSRKDAIPSVGDKATILHYSDRSPAIVTEVRLNKRGELSAVLVQEIDFKINNWQSGYADEYFPEKPVGEPKLYKVVTHGKKKGQLPGIMIGRWDAYRDPHF